ncbi:hypothetical protein [Jannaschia rubra]|uniref:Flagellar basal body-associated protein FliL n=1 Tax=Jannaschia rubra TaxID=282197 RepID=A0A0M6XQU3_9RHOB|nr:hypothetical protein [Jannaschia rubra]CTQ33238.1 hypothetical protein JAN5088_02019 [Jannaschia rubra]SFF97597.1 hypothetical protein SAMN04488517_10267 [Jannaschia rubra]
MGKLLPILVVVLSLGGGAAAGHFLRPAPAASEEAEVPHDPAPNAPTQDVVVTFRDGFVVPVLRDGRVWSHAILSLGVESGRSTEEKIYLREPVIRDGLNEALFLHASLGGFDGDFTDPLSMNRLRARLDDVLARTLGDDSARILIVSMARQAG